jgi:hypothetical protein
MAEKMAYPVRDLPRHGRNHHNASSRPLLLEELRTVLSRNKRPDNTKCLSSIPSLGSAYEK